MIMNKYIDMSKTGSVTIPVEVYDKLKADSNELEMVKNCNLELINTYADNMTIRPNNDFIEYINSVLRTRFEEQFGDRGIEYNEISEYNLRVAQFEKEDDKEDGSDDET